MTLKDKKVLIVGATSDIGMVIASYCKKEGAEVIVTGRNTERLLKIEKEGIETTVLDILNEKDVATFVGLMETVDGIVFSVGNLTFLPFMQEKFCTIQETMSLGFSATAAFLSKIRKMKKINTNGSIVFISSINGVTVGGLGSSIYSATKGAMSGLSKSLALELSSLGIRVNCICPGIIDTPKLHQLFSEEKIKHFMEEYPLKKLGKPEDVAQGVVFLLSDGSSWITGTNLIVDGGYSIR
jgi:NAD(P)-dependent dehydrogenase (short-subunit alcohol dehydrogenase family)